MKWSWNPMWIYISLILYLIIRVVEYTTGQKGEPQWIIDFFPYIAPLIFNLFDNIFFAKEQEREQ